MATILIVNKSDLSIASRYEDAAPNQLQFGGPWGDESKTVHIQVPGSMDARAVEAIRTGDVIQLRENQTIKSQLAQADAMTAVYAAIGRATAFGQQLMVKFTAENVILGITQDGKTGEVLTKMAPVIAAMQSGSLYEAIERAKAIPASSYDSKYITHDRLYSFINEIEAYLGVQLSM